jgi:DNA-binding beta-propeller fold protein YncE
MTQNICFDPTFDPQNLTCNISEEIPLCSKSTSTEISPSSSAGDAYRTALLKSAFGENNPKINSLWQDNPRHYSPLGLLPWACSNQGLNGETASIDSGHPAEEKNQGAATDAGSAPLMRFTGQELHAQTPCGPKAMIPYLDQDVATCVDAVANTYHLFRWDPSTAGLTESIAQLAFRPDQVLHSASGDFFVTVYDPPGMVMIDPAAGSTTPLPFPKLNLSGTSSKGNTINSLQPNFPKGLVEAEGNVFVASSNFNASTYPDIEYFPGTVLVYDPKADKFDSIVTQGYNPTSLATQNGFLYVVSSGAINKNTPLTHSYFEVYNTLPPYNRLQAIDLGPVGAGVGGKITLSPDGHTALLPTADNSGRLLVIDLNTNRKREIALPVGVGENLLANVRISEDNRQAFIGNYNDGKVYVIDLNSGALTEAPILVDNNTLDTLGISDGILIGGKLYLGVGSEILRLGFE